MAKNRVLIVEDEHDIAGLIKHTIERSGDAVAEIVNSGDAALQAVGIQPPDLIILDLNLPGIDGRAVLARIKADERLRVRPVVILTSSDAERDIVQSYELGANCYIVKPMDFNGFRAAVGAVEAFWLSLVTLPPLDR